MKLYPISAFGHFGYIDAEGQVVVAPTLAWARVFRHGLGAVCTADGRWGYVDAQGAFALPAAYDEADDFDGDVAIVGREGKKGVVDRRGAWVVRPSWSRIERDGSFWRVESNEKVGWLTAVGEPHIAPRFREVWGTTRTALVVDEGKGPCLLDVATGQTSELPADEVRSPGTDTIPAREGELWGWLDARGAWLLKPRWGFVDAFVGARARIVNPERTSSGLVDRAGSVVVPPTLHSLHRWHGVWVAEDARGFWLLDDEGTRRSGPWRAVRVTGAAGVILVQTGTGWGAVDRDGGAVVVEPIHEELADGGEGLVTVRRGTLWGYLAPREAGRLQIEPVLSEAARFDGALAFAEREGVYLNRSGWAVWRRPPTRSPVLTRRPLRSADWGAVKEGLGALAATPGDHVFGARGLNSAHSGHAFAIGARLREDEVRQLEERHRVVLPPELRSFLIEVGNGRGPHTTPHSGGAGPGHGLYEIGAALDDAPSAHRPFTAPRSRAGWLAARAREEEAVPPGLVVIGTHGCAFDYGIVVTGSGLGAHAAGAMWCFVDPGWVPDAVAWAEILHAHHDDHGRAHEWCWEHVDELQVRSFADVYMDWFEHALKGLSPR